MASTPQQHSLESLTEGQSTQFEFVIDDAELDKFSDLSGDHNPIHCDTDFARSRGFAGRVVHGALLIAKLSRMIGMELPGRDSLWHGVEMQFRRPLIAGRPAVLEATVTHVSPATRSITLAVKVRSEGATIARGQAHVTIMTGEPAA